MSVPFRDGRSCRRGDPDRRTEEDLDEETLKQLESLGCIQKNEELGMAPTCRLRILSS
jgi:hypothetical protein